MATKPDDLEAVRTIADALSQFDDTEKERILRWAREKVGLKISTASPEQSNQAPVLQNQAHQPNILTSSSTKKDIKTFLQEKDPTSANQLVAAVAYYYKFEASESEKKSSITKEDVLDACRKATLPRPKAPAVVMVNAAKYGLIDNVGTGAYEINSVGENLVAVAMPTSGKSSSKKSNSKSKVSTKKKKNSVVNRKRKK